jgi:hypothetical protein
MATTATHIIAAAVARARREIGEHFAEHEAYSPSRAVTYEPRSRIHQRQFEILVGRGVLKQTADGRYWLDRDAFRLEEERRRAAAIMMLKIVLIGVALAILGAALITAAR